VQILVLTAGVITVTLKTNQLYRHVVKKLNTVMVTILHLSHKPGKF